MRRYMTIPVDPVMILRGGIDIIEYTELKAVSKLGVSNDNVEIKWFAELLDKDAEFVPWNPKEKIPKGTHILRCTVIEKRNH